MTKSFFPPNQAIAETMAAELIRGRHKPLVARQVLDRFLHIHQAPSTILNSLIRFVAA